MKLQIQCKECKASNWLRQNSESRTAFEKTYGKSIEVVCKKCRSKHIYSSREIRAKSRFVPFIAIALLLLGSLASFKYLSGLTFGSSNLQLNYLLLPTGLIIIGLIFSAILRSEELKKRNFNRSI